ncbi:MAG: hypothetical protein Q7S28_00490 [bacterium]|nr:hypothetical protein [bacterium]
MKYGELNLGQIEALVNKLGGMDGVRRFLSGETVAKVSEQIYKVPVDYSRRLDAMIKDGRYDYVNPDITEKHFPEKRRGMEDIEIKLFHLNRVVNSDEATREIEKDGIWRRATLPELLALGASRPELQREFSIVAPGSVWQLEDVYRGVPYLWSGGLGRGLDLDWGIVDWGSSDRFAAVRKPA